jgi:hypothetical protein
MIAVRFLGRDRSGRELHAHTVFRVAIPDQPEAGHETSAPESLTRS